METLEFGAINPVLNNLKTTKGITAVVAADGSGKYLTIQAAVTAGETNIFIKAGNYSITSDLTLGGVTLVGESSQQVKVTLTACTLILESDTTENAGTVTLTNGSKIIAGVGTTFTNLAGESNLWILLQGTAYEVDSITNDTSMELKNKFAGKTEALLAFVLLAAPCYGCRIENISFIHSVTAFDNFVHVFGVFHTIRNCSFRGNADYTSMMFLLSDTAFCIFDNNIISHAKHYTFSLSKTHNATFINNRINSASSMYTFYFVLLCTHINIVDNICYGAYRFAYSIAAVVNHVKILGNHISNLPNTAIDIVAHYITISNNTFLNIDEHAIDINAGSTNAIITENIIDTIGNNGIVIADGDNHIITNNKINDLTGAGIVIATNENCISNNIVLNSSTTDGIIVSGHRNTVQGNQVHDNNANGIYVTGDNNTVIGNSVQNNGDNGIELPAGADKNTVIGNVVLNNTTAQIANAGANNDVAHNVIV